MVDLREILGLHDHHSCVKVLQELFEAVKTLPTITGDVKPFYTFFNLFFRILNSTQLLHCALFTELTLVSIINIKREIFVTLYG